MAWGELKKEDLVKVGVDPDALKAMGDKINDAASKNDITELKTTLASTQETLRALENSLRTVAAAKEGDQNDQNDQNRNRPQNQNSGQPQPVNIDPLAFMEDPQGSVRRLVSEAMGPTILHSLNVAAELAYNQARQRLPYFEKFESEIKELWNKYTPGQKGKPDELIENLYNLVRGRHLDEIMTDTNKKDGKYNLVQSGGTTVMSRVSGDGGSGRKPEDDLTEQERATAARFGMTPAEWAAQKGNLKYV